MKPLLYTVAIYIFFSYTSCTKTQVENETNETELKVLIFSKTNAYRHESIEPGGIALIEYFQDHNISATQSDDSTMFNGNNLSQFDVVIFFNTTGNILDSTQENNLVKHIRAGKGFVGIHSASDTEYDWVWYSRLVGAQFATHPDIQKATVVKIDTHHIANKHLTDRWTRTDEWYNFRKLPDSVTVLLAIDETTYEGGTHDSLHPVSWYHNYDGGRSFYTAMGHTVESYQDTLFLKHILEGVIWAAGNR